MRGEEGGEREEEGENDMISITFDFKENVISAHLNLPPPELHTS